VAGRSHLDWPFFEAAHRELARTTRAWCEAELGALRAVNGLDDRCRALVRSLGRAGLLQRAVAAGASSAIDVRAVCVVREILAEHWGLADFAFAMQGLGCGPISLFGSPSLRARYAPRVASGEAIAAFAISERGAGSDLAAIATTAQRDGPHYVIEGEKTWISNAGLADFYLVFARTGEGPGTRGISAFVVDADAPGLSVSGRIEVTAPHPLGTLRFEGCRVGEERRVGEAGRGMAVALGTLDVFRASVGAAAVGFARQALYQARGHARTRRAFGSTLGDLQLVQRKLSDMATAIDASALLVYRAAWTKDTREGRVTSEAAMAKSFATEAAQGVIDEAVQILGAGGVVHGSVVEELYREIRPLRIYEGATDVQKLLIARELLREEPEGGP
jgi:acyl-CoA dehydrogenase